MGVAGRSQDPFLTLPRPAVCSPKGYSSLQLARSLEGMARVPSKLGSLTLWPLVQFPQGESPGAWRVRRQEVFIPSLPSLMPQVGRDSLPQAGVGTVSPLTAPRVPHLSCGFPFPCPTLCKRFLFPFPFSWLLGFCCFLQGHQLAHGPTHPPSGVHLANGAMEGAMGSAESGSLAPQPHRGEF